MKTQKSKLTVPARTNKPELTKLEVEHDIMTDRMSMPDNSPSIERQESFPKRSQIDLKAQQHDTV